MPANTAWAARGTYFDQLRAKAAETPGVTMAAISSNATPPRNGWDSRFEILGQPAAEQQKASVNLISPAYFGILRIPLLAGRIWDDAENRNGARVAVINQALVKRYFPNGAAIGRSVKLPQLGEDSPDSLSSPKIADSSSLLSRDTMMAIARRCQQSRPPLFTQST